MSIRRFLALGLALIVAIAPVFMTEFQLIQMNYIGMGALIALGLVLLTGVAGVMSFSPVPTTIMGIARFSLVVP